MNLMIINKDNFKRMILFIYKLIIKLSKIIISLLNNKINYYYKKMY